MIISGEPLINDIVKKMGTSIFSRMLARIREMTLLTKKLENGLLR